VLKYRFRFSHSTWFECVEKARSDDKARLVEQNEKREEQSPIQSRVFMDRCIVDGTNNGASDEGEERRTEDDFHGDLVLIGGLGEERRNGDKTVHHPPSTFLLPPETELIGPTEMYVEKESTLNLTCIVRNTLNPPANIQWFHNQEEINYDSPRGGVSVVTEKGLTGTRSSLILLEATPKDSGNFSCLPAWGDPASLYLHVLHDKKKRPEVNLYPPRSHVGMISLVERRIADPGLLSGDLSARVMDVETPPESSRHHACNAIPENLGHCMVIWAFSKRCQQSAGWQHNGSSGSWVKRACFFPSMAFLFIVSISPS
ncbi:unnamed protein product, partial [Darwinula stevensoni]